MDRPSLVTRTRVVTTSEEELVTLQRDVDAEYYEAQKVPLQKVIDARGEIINRLTAVAEEQRGAGRKEVYDWIEAHPYSTVSTYHAWLDQLRKWGLI